MGTDTRFYSRVGSLNARDIASEIQGDLAGDPLTGVEDVAPASTPRSGALVFITADEVPEALTQLDCVVIAKRACLGGLGSSHRAAVIGHDNPKAAFAMIATRLVAPREDDLSRAIHPSAVIAPDAVIAAGAFIGADARIGEGCVVGPNAMIGAGVELGEGSRVGPGAVVSFALIGHRCSIGPGAVIGGAGFGLVGGPAGLLELPHFGRVIIGDDVRIGANCTIDRGMFGDTTLGDGVKLDNLCHIAHNVQVGAHTLMAAFAGVAGSVNIGRGVQFGGRVGIVDHVTVGDGARLAGNASPAGDVPPGETWAGQPAKPIRDWLRELAVLKRLASSRRRGG